MDYREFMRRAVNMEEMPKLVLPEVGRPRYIVDDDEEEEEVCPTRLGNSYALKYRLHEEENIQSLQQEEERTVSLEEVEGVTSIAGTLPNPNEVLSECLNQVYQDYDFTSISSTQRELLAYKYKQEILDAIESNSVVIIKGQTGCGKSTQVPQYILNHAAAANIHCNIVITQPRRIATVSVAKRVAFERGWNLGSLVGYQIGLDKEASADTRLLYCTTGVLLEKLIKLDNFSSYTHIIVDEVHERNQETDFLLILLKRFLTRHACRTKVILMSATIDTDTFSNYFAKKVRNVMVEPPVIILKQEIKYPVSIFFLEDLVRGKMPHAIPEVDVDKPEISTEAYNLTVSLIKVFHSIDNAEENSPGSVLVFLPGLFEIETMYSLLDKNQDKSKENWWLCPLHSTITIEEQRKVFKAPPLNSRKIILATNIAESSITVSDIKYVIDFCLTKHQVQEVNTSYSSLQLSWMSVSQGAQRAGRVGRVMPGRVYRLVPSSVYQLFEKECEPEILRCPLDQLVLRAKRVSPTDPPKKILALALNPPDLSNIVRTILTLKEVGALLPLVRGEYVEDDGELTFIGSVMSSLPLDTRLSRLIVIGHMFGVLNDAIIMACGMAVRNVFSTPFKDHLQAYNVKLNWADSSNSDSVAILNAYKVWTHKTSSGSFQRSTGFGERGFSKIAYLQPASLKEMSRLVSEVTNRLNSLGITSPRTPVSNTHHAIILKIVLAGAFFPNYFLRSQTEEKDAVKLLGGHDPFSTVYLQNFPMEQPGQLYASSIAKLFHNCGKVHNVSFDGSSKVYVQFEESFDMDRVSNSTTEQLIPGQVKMGVYRAIKLRHNRFPLFLRLLNPQLARKRAEELFAGYPNRPLHLQSDKSLKTSVKTYLPGLTINYMQVTISHVDSPSKFWVQIRNEECERRLLWMNQMLNFKGNLVKLTREPNINQLVAAPFKDDPSQSSSYYRGRVKSLHTDDNHRIAEIFFVDYGNVEIVHVRDLMGMGMELVKRGLETEPALALECSLAEVRPCDTMLGCARWSQEAIGLLRKHTDTLVTVKVYSVVNSVISVILFLKGSRRFQSTDLDFEHSFNHLLVEKKLAKHCDEPYLSREDHEMRETASRRPDQVPMANSHAVSDCASFPDPPAPQECSLKVKLTGPWSPLEMRLYCLTRKCLGKVVQMEMNSVNSVLLDSSPMDPHQQFVIAASVSQSPSGDNLTLRNTTLMPHVHGLLSLCCLIFSPRSELRTNAARTQLLGAICGLGYNPNTGKSLYPANDMEIDFDCHLDLERDIVTINKLRFWMNRACSQQCFGDKDGSLVEVEMAQKKILQLITELLERRRESLVGLSRQHTFRWGEVDPDHLLEPGDTDEEHQDVFPLIWGISLDQNSETTHNHRILTSLQQLSRYANGSLPMRNSVLCDVCQIHLDDIKSLRLHVNSTFHKSAASYYQSKT